MHRGEKGDRVKGRRKEERREGGGADSTWQPLRKYTSKRACQRWDQLVNAEERSGNLKTGAASLQWQRSGAAEQAAETEKVRGRRRRLVFFLCGEKVLTQILGAGDTGREKNATTLVTLAQHSYGDMLHFQCVFV